MATWHNRKEGLIRRCGEILRALPYPSESGDWRHTRAGRKSYCKCQRRCCPTKQGLLCRPTQIKCSLTPPGVPERYALLLVRPKVRPVMSNQGHHTSTPRNAGNSRVATSKHESRKVQKRLKPLKKTKKNSRLLERYSKIRSLALVVKIVDRKPQRIPVTGTGGGGTLYCRIRKDGSGHTVDHGCQGKLLRG